MGMEQTILDTHIYWQGVVSTFPFIQYYPFTIRSNIAHIFKVKRGRHISYFGREFQWDDNYPVS